MARSVRAVHVVSCSALQTALLDGVAMDFPVSDVATRQDAFIVSGWMLDKRHRLERLWVQASTGPINVAFDRFRHGGLPNSGPEDRFGYSFVVNLWEMPEQNTIEVYGVFKGSEESLLLFRFEVVYLDIEVSPALTPIIITSMGRSGTTLLMGLLSRHPAVAAPLVFPYEERFASYYANAFREISVVGTSGEVTQTGVVRAALGTGVNNVLKPGLFKRLRSDARLNLCTALIAQNANAVRQIIDACYSGFAPGQNSEFFAEKMIGYFKTQSALYTLYPDLKEIILVRDFRDTFTSAMKFNEKRGIRGFGAEQSRDDGEWISKFSTDAAEIMSAAKQRPNSFVIQYEDLIRDTGAQLQKLFRWLNIEAGEAVVSRCISDAEAETNNGHLTSATPEASVSRWRTDLDPQIARMACSKLEAPLRYFGYSL